MKLLKFIYCFFFAFAGLTAFSQKFPPKPSSLVYDGLKVLTGSQAAELEAKLLAFDKKSSTQIAIVTTDDIQGMDAGDYATELGKYWGVGNTNFNNGVVFLVYKSKDNTSRKVFIATGTGLESSLPDYLCSEIINSEVKPNLRGGDFYRALDNGTNAIIKATEGKYVAPEGYSNRGQSKFPFLLIILVFLIVLFIISRRGGGGTYMSRRGGYRGFEGPTIWWTGGGGSNWTGGGGSSGGGGFGGFGGGDFGGGGAGGDW
jgi:uncharacterized protein